MTPGTQRGRALWRNITAAIITAALLAACSSTPPPTARPAEVDLTLSTVAQPSQTISYPIRIVQSTPSATVTFRANKPAGAVTARLTLKVWGADMPNEGELRVNGQAPILLFGDQTAASNVRHTVVLEMPASHWRQGENTLSFRLLRTFGFFIDDIQLEFLVPAGEREPQPIQFPLRLTEATPTATVTVRADKPAGAATARLTLKVWGADMPDEGELQVNGNPPIPLFGNQTAASNVRHTVVLEMPASHWHQGENTLTFRRLRTFGYFIDDIALEFTSSPTAPPPSASLATRTFSEIPLSSPDLPNPSRGYFQHYSRSAHPDNLDFIDVYFRFNWIELEPQEGRYDFSPIQAQLNRLRPGQKLAIRLMTLNSFAGRDTIPDYVRTRARGTQCGGAGRWVPDWSDRFFQERVEALFTEFIRWLAADPGRLARIHYIDSGLYGNFGEGHLFPFDQNGCVRIPPLEVRAWYYEMQWRVMQSHAPTLRFVANSFGAQADLFVRVASLSPQIGIRTDSLNAANGWFDNQWLNYPAKLAIINERWQTAPHFVEYIEVAPGSSMVDHSFARALSEVQRWRIAGVANNGFNRLSDLSATALANARLIGRLTGYRLVLREVSYPETLSPGQAFTLTSRWSNVGRTPLYEPFAVTFELRRNGAAVWSAASALELTRLLPTVDDSGRDTPITTSDSFTLPQLAAGSYELVLIVRDPAGYRLPLQLANDGRQGDGSYRIGTVTVR